MEAAFTKSRPTAVKWHTLLLEKLRRQRARDAVEFRADSNWNRPLNWLHHYSLVYELITNDLGLQFCTEYKAEKSKRVHPIDFAGLLPDEQPGIVVDDEGTSGDFQKVITHDEGRNLQHRNLTDALKVLMYYNEVELYEQIRDLWHSQIKSTQTRASQTGGYLLEVLCRDKSNRRLILRACEISNSGDTIREFPEVILA